MPNHPLTKRAKPLSAEEMRTDLFQEHLRVFGELPHHRSSSAKITADIEAHLEAAAGKAKAKTNAYSALIADIAPFKDAEMDAQCDLLLDTQRECKRLALPNATAAAATSRAAKKVSKEETAFASVRARRKLAEKKKDNRFIQGIILPLRKLAPKEEELGQVLEAFDMVREEFVAMGAQSAAEADHKQKEQESAQLQGEMDQNKKTIVDIEIRLKKFLSKKRKRDAAPAKGGKGLMERYASLPFEEEEDVQDDNNESEDNDNNLEQSSSQNIAADFFHNLQQDGGAPRGASAKSVCQGRSFNADVAPTRAW